MKPIISILILLVLLIQISVKTGVVGYYSYWASRVAADHCKYKEMTVCKGSCYITQKIKIISSDTEEKQEVPSVPDIHLLKEITGAMPEFSCFYFSEVPLKQLVLWVSEDDLLNGYSTSLLRPPLG